MERVNNEEIAEYNNNTPGTGRKYHRHTPSQTRELESFFNLNQHPEKKERLELGRKLSLDSNQVKFWFQNKRTQFKTQLDRNEHNLLKQNNQDIRHENQVLQEALRTSVCINCNESKIQEEERKLRMEIDHMKVELRRMTALARRCLDGTLIPNSVPIEHNETPITIPSAAGILIGQNSSVGKFPFRELAHKAMHELGKLVHVSHPLWIPHTINKRGEVIEETLNINEYLKSFPPCLEVKLNAANSIRCATRSSAIVAANSSSILHALTDEKQWLDLFPSIIGRTGIIEIIQDGIITNSNFNGILQMMYIELQPLSHVVPVRRAKFLRFSSLLAEGVWGIVDVSVERSHEASETSAFFNCTRFPSGCIVQDLPNGCSKVTWVEHLEYVEPNIHPLVVCSRSSFGAQRWLASLQRQCQCLAIITSLPVSTHDDQNIGMITQTGKRSIVNMAHRMMRAFGFGLCSTVHQWELVQTGETRLNIRYNVDNPGEPTGVVLSAANSVWMPVSHQRLFDFLNSKQLSGVWEEFHLAMPLEELVRIEKSNEGNDDLNRVSLLRKTVISNGNMNQYEELVILQETQFDSSGSMLVFAEVDIAAMQVVMSGEDSSFMKILPSGFSIVPNIKGNEFEEESCVMTVAFQILVINCPENLIISTESIEIVNNLMSRRIQRIQSALLCG